MQTDVSPKAREIADDQNTMMSVIDAGEIPKQSVIYTM